MPTDADRQDEANLVTAIAAGDERSLEQVYARYSAAVWGLARRLCADRSMAEEVTQTVFTDLWSQPGRFDPERGSLRTWLLTQTHGRAVDAIRSETSRRRRQDRDAQLSSTTRTGVDVALGQVDLADGVRRAMATLPETEQAAIVLTYFRGHTYREAAVLLGLPEGTTKSQIRSGLNRLRSALSAAGLTEGELA